MRTPPCNLLLNLPNELILQVFEDLLPKDLLALSKLCRRLNSLALPFSLLRDYSIQNLPDSLWIQDHSSSPFPALNTCISLTSCQGITATVRNLDKIRGLDRLLQKLSNVRFLCIQLYTREEGSILAIHSLLTTAIAKTTNSLSVITLASPSTMIFGIWTGEGETPRKQAQLVHYPNLDQELPCRPMFTEFTVDSQELLQPPFVRWTVKVINASSLTILSLKNSSASKVDWDSILSSIKLSSLRSFAISESRRDISFPTVLAFASRQLGLQTFDCRGLRPRSPNPSSITLPHVNHLVSSISSIESCLENANTFPALSRINITWDPMLTWPEKWSMVGFFQPALDRGNISLSIDVPCTAGSPYPWSTPGSRGPVGLLGRITRLTVHPESSGPDERSRLIEWLVLLPSLREVIYNPLQELKKATRTAFIRSLSKSCSKLETVGIGNESHSVDEWFAMES